MKIEMNELRFRALAGGTELLEIGPVTMTIAEREFFTFIDAGFFGASAVLRMIGGLSAPSSGTIELVGATGRPKPAGLVFSSPLLLPWRTALGNIMLNAELRGEKSSETESRARWLLATVGLPHAAEAMPHELSSADARRIALCRALVPQPEVLLMDDLLQGVDALARENLVADIQRLWIAGPVTTVLVTSQIWEAVMLSDRVAVMPAAPGEPLQIVPVELLRPRRADKDTCPLIADYAGRIRTLMQSQGILS